MSLTPVVRSLVSLWVPAYVRVGDLVETIASVQAQTDPDWQLTVSVTDVNGPQAEAVRTCQASDARVVLAAGQCMHPGVAHNEAIAQTPSRQVIALQYDDLLAPAYLESVTHSGDELVHTAVVIPGETQILTPPPLTVDQLTAGPPVSATACQRRGLWERLGGYDTRLPADAVMWDYLLRAAENTRASYLPQPLTVTRCDVHQRSDTATRAHIVRKHSHRHNLATRRWADAVLGSGAEEHTPHEILSRDSESEQLAAAAIALRQVVDRQQQELELLLGTVDRRARIETSARESGPRRGLVLLAWNEFWFPLPLGRVPGCPAGCELTTDRSRLAEADAVLFHLPSLVTPPDLPRIPGQARVGVSMESDANYPQLRSAEFMRGFDVTMTYRLDSDIPAVHLADGPIDDFRTPPRPKTEPVPVVHFASNARTRSGREQYAAELMAAVGVDSYGGAQRNRVLEHDEGRSTKLATISRYKFTLAFENSIAKDYVTEKFFDPLRVGSVPVYLGAPNAADFAPAEHSFIDARDFAGPAELGAYLRHLSEDEHEYAGYLAWRGGELRAEFTRMLRAHEEHLFRRLCRLLARHHEDAVAGV